MASDEPIGASHEHGDSIIHVKAYKARICDRDDLTIGGPSTAGQAKAGRGCSIELNRRKLEPEVRKRGDTSTDTSANLLIDQGAGPI